MKLQSGDKVIPINLDGIDDQTFDSQILLGRPYLISFFRFAGCPFCNMRIHTLTKRYNEFSDKFTIIAIFDSPLDNLKRHALRHQAPFPILADPENTYYKAYGIEHSFLGIIKGLIFRAPTWIRSSCKGFIPRAVKGSMTIMPAEFLIDEKGIIKQAYYGKDEGDHLAIDRIIAFSHDQD